MLVRNVGHLMTNPAILDQDGNEVPEGLMDAMFTSLIAMHDIGKGGANMVAAHQNSATGSMYMVKPEMHGPEEVAFAVETLDRVENILGMEANTIKMGIMDEERRQRQTLKNASALRNIALCLSIRASSIVLVMKCTPLWKQGL